MCVSWDVQAVPWFASTDKEVVDVGPRSAHIAGCEYACFTPEEEIEDPQIEMVSPKPGDPEDYVTIRLKNGKRICFTNTCAANVLGLIEEKYFAHGNAAAAVRLPWFLTVRKKWGCSTAFPKMQRLSPLRSTNRRNAT